MSAMPPHPDSGGTSDRVRCAYCGANNFPASPACWQCHRPLRPLSVGAPAGPVPSTPSALGAPQLGGQAPSWNAGGPVAGVSPGLAPKAAAALGLLLPWAGLPIGIAFLMLDDPRKVRLGWIAIGWSIAGTILNLLPLLGLWSLIKLHLPSGGGGVPGLPSAPPTDGGDLNTLCLRLLMF